ncbi:hypothetical protein C8Q78DRAFT_1048309 [Trametes maxima]|nr:hypothetical protein C8Q78DRAFT_1048309 [Trametes maxima]
MRPRGPAALLPLSYAMARTSLIRQKTTQPETARANFPSPFQFNGHKPITLVELRMRKFSGMIRSKPGWWEKVRNTDLVAKWREEMVEQDRIAVEKLWGGDERYNYTSQKKWPRDPVTDAQLEYVFDQLRYEAERYDPITGIFATSIPMVYESRTLVPADSKADLISGVSVLEDIPDNEKDWHPGSNKHVLDLVHPSLYCLRIGESYVRSRRSPDLNPSLHVLTNSEYASLRPDFEELSSTTFTISRSYQWLPTDFEVSEFGEAKALGYINNLHPDHHKALYPIISSIISRFVPLWERVLTDALGPPPSLAIEVDPYAWYSSIENPEWDYNSPDYSDKYEEWEKESHWPVVPDPAPFAPPVPPPERVDFKLRGRTIQVIVKLANIVLTPENPKYPGGSWHVEGMANENIVATGLYYYACDNITQSRLDFRHFVGDSEAGVYFPYEQSDDKGYSVVYGFSGGDPMNQEIGHIVAEEDKCIAFPNVYQHCVDAFELADKSRPGYRKILCFFLVNPTTQILSTADVPPQQADWSMKEMVRAPGLRELPAELFDMIVDYAQEGTITREEAQRHREELMKERVHFVAQHNEQVYEMEFNMCEH